MGLYTVGPQLYIVTTPGFCGMKSSFDRESVLVRNIRGAPLDDAFFFPNNRASQDIP
jgi:hypothetical protein